LRVCYNVSGEGEPDVEPELTLNIPEYLEVTEKELLIEGKTNPGATLYLQGEEVAKNSDGSFKKLITLSKGENTLSFTSKEGSLQTVKKIKIVLKKKIEILLKIGDKASFLNSELKTLPEAPLILNGITFVPLRFISEAFGANVSWVKEESKIIILFNDITLIMWIGKDRAELNGKELKLSAKPFISKSGITFVPLRIISEVFGAEVSWNAENSTITIKLKVDYEKDSQLESFNLLKSEEEVSSSVLIDATKPPEDVIFPSCFDIWKDEIYVSTYKGIYVLDKELNIKRKIDYPSQLEESIEPSYLRALTSTYSRNFLRVNEKFIIFSDGNNIFVFDKNNGEMKTNISRYFYGTLLSPLRKFRMVMDLEIYEDKLFVLDSFYGVDVIDITSGELLSRFDIYDFLVDVALANGKIYVISFLGRIYKLGLNGEDMESFKTEDTIFPFSLLATDDGFIYLNLSYPEYTLLKINPSNNWEIVKEYKLSSSIGQYLDRILPLDDNIYALAFNSRNSSSYLFEEKLVKLDKNFKLLGKVGSDGYNKVKTNDKFLISPEYVWYTNDGDYLLSQYYPLNPDYFKLYSKTGELKKAFPITPKDYNWIKISSAVQGNVIGTLFINYMTYKYYFEISEFTSKGTLKSKSVELKPTTKYYDYADLAFNDKLIITSDYYTGEIVEFDINSGEEIKRFSLSEAQNEASLYFPYSIKLIDDKIYIFDFVKKVIRIYSLEGEIFSELDYKCYSEIDKIKFYTDARLMDNNKFALIDSENANLLIFDSESLSEVIGKKKRLAFEEEDEISTELESLYLPYSFDIKEDSLLINDLGNYRVIERPHSYSKSEKLSCKIKLSPENLDLVAYSKDSLESKVLVEIFNSDAPLEVLESPPWITIDKFDQSLRNSLITFKIDPSKTEVNNFTRGIITFKVSDQIASLKINLVRKTNEITFYSKSSLIKGNTKNYISKAKAELRKGIILVSDDAVKNVFGFDVKRVEKEVIIFTESFTVKLKVGERKGSLLLPSSEVIIDLGEPLEEKCGILLIPMNTILNFLSINYKVDSELIKIFLT